MRVTGIGFWGWMFVLVSLSLGIGVYLVLWVQLPMQALVANSNPEQILQRITVGVRLRDNSKVPSRTCNMNSCFNWSRCVTNRSVEYPKVYLYPQTGLLRRWYQQMRSALARSSYVARNPDVACLFFPGFDISCDSNNKTEAEDTFTKKLRELKHWHGGLNHMIFEFSDWPAPIFDVDSAMLFRSNSVDYTFREGFDESIPILFAKDYSYVRRSSTSSNDSEQSVAEARKYLAVFKGSRYSQSCPSVRTLLPRLHDPLQGIIISTKCYHWPPEDNTPCDLLPEATHWAEYSYEALITNSLFCLVPEGCGSHSYRLFEALSLGCIPVVLADHYVPPYRTLVEWKEIAIFFPVSQYQALPKFLRSLPPQRISLMRRKGMEVYDKHFSSPDAIIKSLLAVLGKRIAEHL